MNFKKFLIISIILITAIVELFLITAQKSMYKVYLCSEYGSEIKLLYQRPIDNPKMWTPTIECQSSQFKDAIDDNQLIAPVYLKLEKVSILDDPSKLMLYILIFLAAAAAVYFLVKKTPPVKSVPTVGNPYGIVPQPFYVIVEYAKDKYQNQNN